MSKVILSSVMQSNIQMKRYDWIHQFFYAYRFMSAHKCDYVRVC